MRRRENAAFRRLRKAIKKRSILTLSMENMDGSKTTSYFYPSPSGWIEFYKVEPPRGCRFVKEIFFAGYFYPVKGIRRLNSGMTGAEVLNSLRSMYSLSTLERVQIKRL